MKSGRNIEEVKMSISSNSRSLDLKSQQDADDDFNLDSNNDGYTEIALKLTEMRSALLKKIRQERNNSDQGDGEGILNSESSKTYSAQLLRISDALNRLRHDVYGICKICEEAIPKKRLLDKPLARLCEECQKAGERKIVLVKTKI